MMLELVRKALRVSHDTLDDEISDLIESARADLSLSGVGAEHVESNTDPMIKRAIITYAKAHFVADVEQAERFQVSYDLLKNHLTLAGDYRA